MQLGQSAQWKLIVRSGGEAIRVGLCLLLIFFLGCSSDDSSSESSDSSNPEVETADIEVADSSDDDWKREESRMKTESLVRGLRSSEADERYRTVFRVGDDIESLFPDDRAALAEALAALVRLEGEGMGTRDVAARSLAELSPVRALDCLRAVWDREDLFLSDAVSLVGPIAVPWLQERIENDHGHAHINYMTLGLIAVDHPTADEVKEAVPLLEQGAGSSDAMIRSAAGSALAAIRE